MKKNFLILIVLFLVACMHNPKEAANTMPLKEHPTKAAPLLKSKDTHAKHSASVKTNSVITKIKKTTVPALPERAKNDRISEKVKTTENASAFPKVKAVITDIYVYPGQSVKAGQTIAQLDNSAYKQKLTQAQNQVDIAKAAYTHQKALWDKKTGVKKHLVHSNIDLQIAQKQLSVIKKQADNYIIKSPVDGTIGQINLKSGEIAQPGINIATIIVARAVTAENNTTSTQEIKTTLPADTKDSPNTTATGIIAKIADAPPAKAIPATGTTDNSTTTLKPVVVPDSSKIDALLVKGNTFERALKMKMDSLAAESAKFTTQELFPNDAMQNVMTPAGWGGYGTYVFGGIGGVYPAVYTHKADMIGSLGFCVGDPIKFVNIAAGLNITKVKALSDLSVNLTVSKKIFKGSSIAVGGVQLFANSIQSDAPDPTFYIAFSHSVQTVVSKSSPESSALSYSIGIGSGRFVQKSPFDVAAGRGKYGTAIFGSISYEVIKHVNLNAEWTGTNFGLSAGIHPFKTALSFGVGVSDLTRYSSDKPSMIISMGYPLSLNRVK